MTVHIGVIPHEGKIAIFDSETNEESYESLQIKVNPSDPANISKMFDEIISKMKKRLGCACFSMNSQFDKQVQDQLIETGQKAGFEKVTAINFKEAIFYETADQTNLHLNDGNILWIINGKDCYIWQKTQQVVHFVKKLEHVYYTEITQLQSIQNDSTIGFPNFIIYNNQDNIDANLIEQAFPGCELHPFNYVFGQNESKGALLKARMIRNDISPGYECHVLNN